VPDKKKRDWLSAKAIYSHWQASLTPKDTPRTPSPAQPHKPSVPADDAEVATLKARIAELQVAHNADTARIRELEDKLALARMATGKMPENAAELEANRRMAEAVRKAEAAARKAAQPKPTVPENETMESLAEKLRQRDQQLKAAQTRIRNLYREVRASKTTLFVDGQTIRTITAALSPSNFPAGSKAFKRAEEAAQLFGSLRIKDPNKPDQPLQK
jgi:hypothetical protein